VRDSLEIAAQIARRIASLSDEERVHLSEKLAAHIPAEFEDFQREFAAERCYVCRKPLRTFASDSPCLHWLLKPNGFKKKNFMSVAKKFGFFRMQAFLRWVANEDKFAVNINDIRDEGTGKLFESTIRWRHLEWSFSCSHSDFTGHADAFVGANPHFHFQMRVEKRSFINFNEFHPPLTAEDVIYIKSMELEPRLRHQFAYGEGIREILENEEALSQVLNSPNTSSAMPEEAPIHLQSVVIANDDAVIHGEDIYAAIQEARAKGVTIASLAHKIPNASAQVFVSPGPGVVEQTPRSRSRKTSP
jgi:hypothetical protein